MEQKQEKSQLTFRESVNVTYCIAKVVSTCLTPFLRCDFGSEVPGLAGVGALVLLLLLAGDRHNPDMAIYLVCWIGALIYQKSRSRKLIAQGWRAHSQYAGRPWLVMKLPFVRSETVAKNLEPVLCLVTGSLICPVSQTLGLFLCWGAVALTVMRCMEREAIRRQVTAMQDLQLEQQAFSQRMRGGLDEY